jgi:hypothetical protein
MEAEPIRVGRSARRALSDKFRNALGAIPSDRRNMVENALGLS